jgi:hypothetical protein
MATEGLDSGVGGGHVKGLGTVALALLLTASATLALVVLVQLWPAAATAGATAGTTPGSQPLDVLTYRFSVTPDVNLILLAAVAGALGGLIHALRSMAWYAGNRALKWSWVAFYLLLVPVSGLIAVVFYIVLRAGLVSTQGSTGGVSPYGGDGDRGAGRPLLQPGRGETQTSLRDAPHQGSDRKRSHAVEAGIDHRDHAESRS